MNAEDPSAERWNEALQKTREKYDAFRAKGFVSPMDIATAAYYMDRYAADPEKGDALRAILDDRTMSSARRIKAMRDVIAERR